jgi:hypothetical protein
VHQGMKTMRMKKPGITMGIYQHTQVRFFHKMYERWLGLGKKTKSKPKSKPKSKSKSKR